jgi:hypothetical protein
VAAVLAALWSGAAAAPAMGQSLAEVERLLVEARAAQTAGDCPAYSRALERLERFSFLTIGTEYLNEPERRAVKTKAEEYVDLLSFEGCPRVSAKALGVEFLAGATARHVPQINAGTVFTGVTESPIAQSTDRLSGGSFGARFKTAESFGPFPGRVTFSFNYYDVSGSSFGSEPRFGRPVATTYLVPNPTNSSTGLGAGASGQSVSINTQAQGGDIVIGTQLRLPFLPDLGPVRTEAGFGVRVVYSRFEHRITQQNLTFPDVRSTTNLQVDQYFVGPNFSLGLSTEPRAGTAGFFVGVNGFVSPGIIIADASAAQHNVCGVCGAASPEANFTVGRQFSDTHFSIMTGAEVTAGYAFSRNFRALVRGSVEHTTDVFTFVAPITPIEQPVRLRTDSSMAFGIRAGIELGFAF